LVVVIAVMSVLVGVGGLRYVGSLGVHRAQRTAQCIAADLAAARHAARSRGASVTIAFDTANHRYTITGLPNPNSPGSANVVDLAEGSHASTLTAASFGGDATIVFNAFGMPDSGGSVTVASGGSTQTVTVEAGTGRATVP
jgi:type II secretory pathway pseudopilin PulG